MRLLHMKWLRVVPTLYDVSTQALHLLFHRVSRDIINYVAVFDSHLRAIDNAIPFVLLSPQARKHLIGAADLAIRLDNVLEDCSALKRQYVEHQSRLAGLLCSPQFQHQKVFVFFLINPSIIFFKTPPMPSKNPSQYTGAPTDQTSCNLAFNLGSLKRT